MLLNICMPQFLHWAFPHLFPTHCKIARPLSLCPGDKKCGHTWVCRDTNSLSKDSRGLLLIEDSFFASHSPERKSLAELPVSLVCVWTPGVEKCKCGGGLWGGMCSAPLAPPMWVSSSLPSRHLFIPHSKGAWRPQAEGWCPDPGGGK